MLGLFTDFIPKHSKQYAKLADVMSIAIVDYKDEVKDGSFPTEKQSFSMDESILAEL
jgi:3-methyl-2-oxobutanoate hydroxymethyltransferase